MLQQAAQELGIDLRHSVLVGDSACDVEAALTAGCQPIIVGDTVLEGSQEVPVVPSLLQALGEIERLMGRAEAVC
jgi:histidinol phosphatase-like enzyme